MLLYSYSKIYSQDLFMKQMNKNAFTMIELIFVIVVLGILSAVAIPKFGGTKNAADTVKGKADIATIRSAILNERQKRVIKGDATYITKAALNTGGLFGGVLQYPMPSKTADGFWRSTGTDGSYYYRINGSDNTFNYYDSTDNNTSRRGKFLCTAGNDCAALTE